MSRATKEGVRQVELLEQSLQVGNHSPQKQKLFFYGLVFSLVLVVAGGMSIWQGDHLKGMAVLAVGGAFDVGLPAPIELAVLG